MFVDVETRGLGWAAQGYWVEAELALRTSAVGSVVERAAEPVRCCQKVLLALVVPVVAGWPASFEPLNWA